jgi:hypothetical protein
MLLLLLLLLHSEEKEIREKKGIIAEVLFIKSTIELLLYRFHSAKQMNTL